MITKLRPRYYCEHCKKSGGRKDVIARHEEGCTANPGRVCGCCRIAAMKQPTIEQLKAAVQQDSRQFGEYSAHDDGESCTLAEAPALLALVTPANCDSIGCPACILTALRATKSSLRGFEFRTAMASWMQEFGFDRDKVDF